MTTHDAPPTPPLEIDGRLAVRIARARGRMPYGGIVHGPDFVKIGRTSEIVPTSSIPSTIDLDGLAEYLEKLADVLGDHVEECVAREDRLRTLDGDLAAAGRLLAAAIAQASS